MEITEYTPASDCRQARIDGWEHKLQLVGMSLNSPMRMYPSRGWQCLTGPLAGQVDNQRKMMLAQKISSPMQPMVFMACFHIFYETTENRLFAEILSQAVPVVTLDV